MSKLEDLNKQLKTIKGIFDKVTISPSNEFVRDYTILSSYLNGDTNVYSANIWNYIMMEYRLPNISVYFNTADEALETVFEKCIHPFYLRLDILPGFNYKYKKLSSAFEKRWTINRFFINNWMIILSIILMLVTLSLSHSFRNSDMFLYDILMGLATGFMISILVSILNFYHKTQLRNKKAEFNDILNNFNYIKKLYKKVKSSILNEKLEGHDLVIEFCNFNNGLSKFIEDTREIKSLNTCSNYLWFIDYDKEIFDYSSIIVNSEFSRVVGDSITEEQETKLHMYIIEFGYYLSFFEYDIVKLEHFYGRDINIMQDKSI